MAPSTILTTITPTNSTTYADEVGVSIGLPRLPGETAESYVKRLKLATRIDTNQDYRGLLNEITLRLGLVSAKLIALAADSPISVTVNLAGIVLTNGSITQNIPLLTVDVDDSWTWRFLSDIVTDINNGTLVNATLLVSDAPTIKLATQSNTLTVLAQPIQGQNINLGVTGVLVGTEVFSTVVPSYTLLPTGSLIFSAPVPLGTTITYKYQIWPYNLVGGDVGLISLLDPAVSTVAQGPNGTMIYQMREAVQTIMQQDRSYWAR